MKFESIVEIIGNTPLVKLKGEYNIFAKLEFFNPLSSIKDRTALALIEDAKKNDLLGNGKIILEPTSGNTGIALAAIAASMGYKTAIVMPESMSLERRQVMSWLGAELILTPAAEGMTGAIKKAEELADAGEYTLMGQFVSKANSEVHYKTTGPEIWRDLNGDVDILVSAVGTGGTISGVGKFLKEQNEDITVIAVEPAESAVLSGEKSGTHGIQGIGAGFIPEILDTDVINEVLPVRTDNAVFTAREIARTNGLFIGISSGAAAFAAFEIAKRDENKGKNIITIFPDSGDRYLSTNMFRDLK